MHDWKVFPLFSQKESKPNDRTHLHDLEVIVVHLRNALKEESGN